MSTEKTRPFPGELIEVVDDVLSSSPSVTFRETDKNAHLSLRETGGAEKIRAALLSVSWDFKVEDDGGPRTEDQAFDADFAPFTFCIEKPVVEGEIVLLHKSSLVHVLTEYIPRVVRIGLDTQSFQLQSTVVCSWEEPVDFIPLHLEAQPKRLVRDLSASNFVPSDLSIWILRGIEDAPYGDGVFEEWKRHAASVYLRVLCTEIEPDGTLLFRSQPVLRICNPGLTVDTTKRSFHELHSLATWAYENKREAETRHGLVVAEIVRASMSAESAKDLVANGFRGILESARHAYQLGLHELGKDALRALADLRKSVADETSKAADFTRQMTTSVAGALFAAVGVLAARLTLAKDNEAFSLVAVIVGMILFVYVVATAINGWYFIRIQRGMRSRWKERTRKFLVDEEYCELVDFPVGQAERAYDWASWISILAAFAAFMAVASVSYPDAMMAAWDWLVALAESTSQPVSATSSNAQSPVPSILIQAAPD